MHRVVVLWTKHLHRSHDPFHSELVDVTLVGLDRIILTRCWCTRDRRALGNTDQGLVQLIFLCLPLSSLRFGLCAFPFSLHLRRSWGRDRGLLVSSVWLGVITTVPLRPTSSCIGDVSVEVLLVGSQGFLGAMPQVALWNTGRVVRGPVRHTSRLGDRDVHEDATARTGLRLRNTYVVVEGHERWCVFSPRVFLYVRPHTQAQIFLSLFCVGLFVVVPGRSSCRRADRRTFAFVGTSRPPSDCATVCASLAVRASLAHTPLSALMS